jgi:oxygen-independent coproporphyrinogen-3 oxidase
MNLRLAEGLDLAAYEKRWNTKLDSSRVESLARDGFLVRESGRLTVTPKGRLVLNGVIAALAN